MDDVVVLTFENRAQLDPRRQVDRVADVQRMTSYPIGGRSLPEPSRGIANQFRAMAPAGQRVRQSEHLRLAPAEAKLGIDAHDAQRRASSRFALGRHLVR